MKIIAALIFKETVIVTVKLEERCVTVYKGNDKT